MPRSLFIIFIIFTVQTFAKEEVVLKSPDNIRKLTASTHSDKQFYALKNSNTDAFEYSFDVKKSGYYILQGQPHLSKDDTFTFQIDNKGAKKWKALKERNHALQSLGLVYLQSGNNSIKLKPTDLRSGLSKLRLVELEPISWKKKDGLQTAIKHCDLLNGTVDIFEGRTYCRLDNSKKLVLKRATYETFSLLISDSNTELNCRGSLLLNPNKEMMFGLVIQSTDEKVIRKITVKNCDFSNYGRTILVRSAVPAGDLYELTMQKKHSVIQGLSPKNVVLDNIRILDAQHVGLYIDAGVVGVTLKNSEIRNCQDSPAIYLEYSSMKNIILNNKIKDNGREGIAVDSSARNIIKGNTISGNKFGGIYLYRNCQERINAPTDSDKYYPKSPLRTQASSYNVITDNLIKDEFVGIWVASRQTKNLFYWYCGNESYSEEPTRNISYHLDFAKHNEISRNTFLNTTRGVIVEDDNNTINKNFFFKNETAVTIDSKRSEIQKSQSKVHNTEVINNQYNMVGVFLEQRFNPSGVTQKNNTEATDKQIFSISSNNSDLCLSLREKANGKSSSLTQENCSEKSLSQLVLGKFMKRDSSYLIKSVATGHCLSSGGRSALGSSLQQVNCQWDNPAQKFQYDSTKNNLMNLDSKLCLDVKAKSKDRGAPLQQWKCGSGAHQAFKIIPYKTPALLNCEGFMCYQKQASN